MSSFSLGYDLERFGRHIPTILVKQLILNNANSFLALPDIDGEQTCKPSIAHFHGALLFVDISGFTVLSQRLHVDELRYHINAYFKRILDIVDCFRGEVVKFLGDAMFILWQIPLDSIDAATKIIVERAFRCGNAINASCSNYAIDLQDSQSTAILNVHSGLSVGFMTGLDVGCGDRWEYLLLGSPLQDVANAEADAAVGELIVSETAHRFLCPHTTDKLRSDPTAEKIVSRFQLHRLPNHCSSSPPCGCTRTPGGCFKIPHLLGCSTANSSHKEDEEAVERDVFFSRYDSIVNDCITAFENIKDEVLEAYACLYPSLPLSEEGRDSLKQYFCQWMLSCLLDDFARHVHEADRLEYVFQNVRRTTACLQAFYTAYMIAGNKHKCFTSASSSYSLASSPSRSLSMIARKTSSWMSMSITSTSNNISFRFSSDKSRKSSSFLHRSLSTTGTTTMTKKTSSSIGDINSHKMRHITSARSMMLSSQSRANSRHDQSFFQQVEEEEGEEEEAEEEELDMLSLGELRNVVVMFIHVFGLPLQTSHAEIAFMLAAVLTVANQRDKSAGVFGNFIATDENATMLAQDTKLLASYQAAITAIANCLSMQGGHLRQFVVDDKGCVAIATFGLRGAVQSDNAASAVATSHQIISSLREAGYGLDAGIGIAYGHGRASTYCGLVGSAQRHEYAIMGPYTNLSARLMGKAQPGEVLCDEGTRDADRDRLHVFKPMWHEEGGLKVKGFEQQVKAFRSSVTRARRVSAIYGYQHVANSISQQERPTECKEDEQVLKSTAYSITLTNNTNTVTQIQLSDGGGAVIMTEETVNIPKKRQLFGREQEVATILQHLSLHNSTNDLPLQQPCHWVAIHGEIGFGKSAILNFISDRLREGNNVTVLENSCTANLHSPRQVRSGAGHDKESFQGWKRVIRQMLAHLSALAPAATAAPSDTYKKTKSNRRRRRSLEQRVEWERLEQKWSLGMSMIINYAASASTHDKEMVNFLPLLSYFRILPVPMFRENVHTATIATNGMDTMLLTCQRLLVWLMEMFVVITKKVLVLALDDVHAIDKWSLSVLREVHDRNIIGMILLTTSTASSVVCNLDADVRRIAIELKSLDYKASKEMIKAILKGAHLSSPSPLPLISSALGEEEDDTIYRQVFFMTGGNPLYIHELCKASTSTAVSETDSKPMSSFVLSHSIARVEETICYRFDRLNSTCQLILKIAAAACYYSGQDSDKESYFTLDLLVFIMLSDGENADVDDDCSDSPSDIASDAESISNDESDKFDKQQLIINLADELEGMLRRQEFIHLAVPSRALVRGSGDTTDDSDDDEDDYEQQSSATKLTTMLACDHLEGEVDDDHDRGLELMSELFVQDKLRRERRGIFKKDALPCGARSHRDCASTVVRKASSIEVNTDEESSSKDSANNGQHDADYIPVTADVAMSFLPTISFKSVRQLQLHTPLAYMNVLEQAGIYNLMLDDQKEALQEKIACYWEMRHNEKRK